MITFVLSICIYIAIRIFSALLLLRILHFHCYHVQRAFLIPLLAFVSDYGYMKYIIRVTSETYLEARFYTSLVRERLLSVCSVSLYALSCSTGQL